MAITIIPAAVFHSGTGSSGQSSTNNHSHSNLPVLNKLVLDSQGHLVFDGNLVADNALEVSYHVVLSEQNIRQCSLELPHDCDTSQAITFTLQGLAFVQGQDWQLIEHAAPIPDVISWKNLALQSVVQQGDLVSITYYKIS